MDDKRKPWGDAYAVKPGHPNESTGEVGKDVWITLGPVWESAQGNFSFSLDVQPLHWNNPNVERRIIITRRKPAQTSAPAARGRK